MTTMQRGFKSKLDTGGVNVAQPFRIDISTEGGAEYDISCFALNEAERVRDDRYIVFFNQPISPNSEITMSTEGGVSSFQVNLAELPAFVRKLSFAVTIDGEGTMREIRSCAVRISQHSKTAFGLDLTGRDFQSQKTIITIEIYEKNGWRVSAVANGFNFTGGLEALMAHYGVEVSAEPPAASPPDMAVPSREAPRISAPAPAEAGPPPVVDDGPAHGKNAEGFDRNDDDWV